MLTADFRARQASQAKRPVPALFCLFGGRSDRSDILLSLGVLLLLLLLLGAGRIAAYCFLPDEPPADMIVNLQPYL